MSAPLGGENGVEGGAETSFFLMEAICFWKAESWGALGEAPPTGDAPEGSAGFLKRSVRGKKDHRRHSGVSQMSKIEIPVELQVRGLYERCIVKYLAQCKG